MHTLGSRRQPGTAVTAAPRGASPGRTAKRSRPGSSRHREAFRRRHLNGEQKRKWAEWFLKRHPEWSDSRVASEVGLSHPTVAKVRETLESSGAVEKITTRVGKDGVAQKAEKAKPAPAPTIFAPSRQVERAQTALSTLGDAASKPLARRSAVPADHHANLADTHKTAGQRGF